MARLPRTLCLHLLTSHPLCHPTSSTWLLLLLPRNSSSSGSWHSPWDQASAKVSGPLGSSPRSIQHSHSAHLSVAPGTSQLFSGFSQTFLDTPAQHWILEAVKVYGWALFYSLFLDDFICTCNSLWLSFIPEPSNRTGSANYSHCQVWSSACFCEYSFAGTQPYPLSTYYLWLLWHYKSRA